MIQQGETPLERARLRADLFLTLALRMAGVSFARDLSPNERG